MRIYCIGIFTLLCFFSCKEKSNNTSVTKFNVMQNLIPDSTIQYLAKEKRDNNIVSVQSISLGLRLQPLHLNNYKCSAVEENDTINLTINNYNGYYGNGILIKVTKQEYIIKSIDPNVIRGTKFEKYKLIKQSLTLNKTNFKKGDSIFGKLLFQCTVDSIKQKDMYGYFKTKIN